MSGYAGKVVVVTGASSGTGEDLARLLHEEGARVIPVGRNADRTAAVGQRVGSTGITTDYLRLTDVAELAKAIGERADRIDVLFSNAGGAIADRKPTVDGNEPNYQVNALAPLLLERLLAPALKAAAHPWIVATSSRSHRGARLTTARVSAELDDSSPSPHHRYARAKLAALTVHSAGRGGPGSIEVVDVHPGIVATEFGRYLGRAGTVLKRLATPFLRTPAEAARLLADVGSLQPFDHPYLHRTEPRPPSPLASDKTLQAAVVRDVDRRLFAFDPRQDTGTT